MNDDDDKLIFEFDDELSMDDLLSGSELAPEGDQPAKHPRKRKIRDRNAPGHLDLGDDATMDELLAAQDRTKSKPSSQERPGLPQDLFEDVQVESMDELIEGSSCRESLSGRIKEISIDGARVNLGDGREGRVCKSDFEDWSAADLGDEVLVDRALEDPGPVYNLRLLKHYATQKSRTVSASTERPDGGVRFSKGDGFIIDGSNVTRSFTADGDPPSLAPLLTLVLAIAENGGRCCCVFDANEQYVLDGESARVYISLLSNHSRIFIEAPGGSNADDYLLKIAHRERLPVISNDRFNKLADRHQEEYSWLVPGSARLMPGEVRNGFIEIPKLGLRARLRSDLGGMAAALRDCDVAL